MENTIKRLISIGYPEAAAKLVADNLSALSGNLKIAADKWINLGIELDVESHGYSTHSLMQRFRGMTYPAALLSIDWLNRDPQIAKSIIENGLK